MPNRPPRKPRTPPLEGHIIGQQKKREPEPIDPDVLKHIATSKEVQLFLFISSLEGVMRQVADDLKNKRITKDNVQDAAEVAARTSESLSVAKQATVRFGVSFDNIQIVNQQGKDLVNSQSEYDRWYKWWQDYIQGMSPDDWDKARAALEADDADIDWIRPAGSWKDEPKPTEA